MRTFSKTMSISARAFAEQFTHPALRQAFRYILFDAVDNLPLLPSCINIANAADKNAGVPNDGSLSISQAVEKRMLELGGNIHYLKKVRKIIVQNQRAVGVELTDGSRKSADIVVGASDGYSLIYEQLEGRYTSARLNRVYASFEHAPGDVFPGTVCMFIGVKADYRHLPAFCTYILEDSEKRSVFGLSGRGISVQVRNKLYPKCAPPGKSVIYISFLSDFSLWHQLDAQAEKASKSRGRHTRRKRTLAYRQAKQALQQSLVEWLEKRIPGLQESIEYIDLATPLTCQRYTGNRHGSIFGWTPLTATNDELEKEVARLKGKLPGLSNFYMAGHWLGNGGVTRSALSGRHVIQYICRDLGRPFTVTRRPPVPCESYLISELGVAKI